MVSESLYHAREMVTIKLSSVCSFKAKSAGSRTISWLFFNKTIMPVALVGYEMIITSYSTHVREIIVNYMLFALDFYPGTQTEMYRRNHITGTSPI